MAAEITTDQVWRAIAAHPFAVLGMVTPAGEARTAGIVYVARNRRLYIGTAKNAWKARWVAANRNVSLTVAIPKRIPFVPWVKIPAATVTFSGHARLLDPEDVDAGVVRSLFRGLDLEAYADEYRILEVVPHGHFLTYGVGVSLAAMRRPEAARGQAPVG